MRCALCAVCYISSAKRAWSVVCGVSRATRVCSRPVSAAAAAAAARSAAMLLRVYSQINNLRLKPMHKYQGVPAYLSQDDDHMIVTAFGPDQVGLIASLN
eukprot:COSAG01_NODE_685_length_14250_cov_18.752032_13_plen_100_part_00